MAWDRRYAPWLLENEERLVKRRDLVNKLTIGFALVVAVLESLWNWDQTTPEIAPTIHIAAVTVVLVLLYFMLQADHRTKLAAFTQAMSDLGRRLFFLDPAWDLEEFDVQQRYQGATLLPTQRYIDKALRTGKSQQLRHRLDFYYRALPATVCEGDRMGLLSVLHPKTALSWGVSLILIWILWPGGQFAFGTSQGLTWIPLLLPIYLINTHLNARFAYELALYSWLRLG